LPEQYRQSSAFSPKACSTSIATSSGRAEGRSILLITGMISSPASMAMKALATVWASTPWVASTTSTAPSQAASDRLTS
jgi:hypothetical protein